MLNQLQIVGLLVFVLLTAAAEGQACDNQFWIAFDKSYDPSATYEPGDCLELTIVETEAHSWPTTPTLVIWSSDFEASLQTESLSTSFTMPLVGYNCVQISATAYIPSQGPDCPAAWSRNSAYYVACRIDATPSPTPPPSPSPTPTCTPKQMDCSVVFDPWPDKDGYLPLSFEFGFQGYAIYGISGPGSPVLEHLGGTSYRISGLEYDSAYQMPWSCEVEECTGEPDNYLRLFPTVPRPTGWQTLGPESRDNSAVTPTRVLPCEVPPGDGEAEIP
ncbi:hypothetical protein KQI84_04445 [bacterium]|nr:hypothetical protein [bacterium]